MNFNRPFDIGRAPETEHKADAAPSTHRVDRRRWGGRLAGLGLVLSLTTALASGAWSHFAQHRLVIATAEQSRDFVPQVRVAAEQPSQDDPVLPAHYLFINGATAVSVQDALGNSTAPVQGDLLGTVPGVTHTSVGDQVTMLTLAAGSAYTVTFGDNKLSPLDCTCTSRLPMCSCGMRTRRQASGRIDSRPLASSTSICTRR